MFAGNPGGATIDLDSTGEVTENVPGGKAKIGTHTPTAGSIEPEISRTNCGKGGCEGMWVVIEARLTPPG